MGVRGRLFGVALAACAVAALTGATGASALSSAYAPGATAQSFNDGDGGWTFEVKYGGLCIPGVTCYIAGSELKADGGPTGGGDGYLRTDLMTIADAVTATNAVLTSPSFVYRGAGGEAPKKLTFTLDRRTDLGAVIPVITDNATFAVKAVPAGAPATTIIRPTSMAGAEDAWTSVPKVELDPNDLAIGQRYQLQITSAFQPGVQVIGTGTVDYDNVVLTARGGGGGGGEGGNAGPGGGLTTAINNLIDNATLKGNKLRVPVGCPRFVAPKTCSLRVVARLRKKGANATAAQGLRVKAAKRRTAVLRVKRAFKDQIEGRKRVVVRVRANAGGKTRTVVKTVKVRHG
jgi:hypothetical protein